MVDELEGLLRKEGVLFSPMDNRMRQVFPSIYAALPIIYVLVCRCFPHVVNIAVDHALEALTEVDTVMEALRTEGSLTPQDKAYLEALRNNILNRCRDVVTTCRASSQRLDDFEDSIADANRSSVWGQDTSGVLISVSPARQLLRDMVIRWSSKFLMIDRVLELLPVSKIAIYARA